MNILDLLQSDGIKVKKVSGTHGGEFSSPCPACGGSDRFRSWPEQGDGGTFWCRGCRRHGDLIQYLKDMRGMKYIEACKLLGREPEFKGRSLDWNRKENKPKWEPKEAVMPSPEWQEKVAAFVAWAERVLWSKAGSDALRWLQEERGFTSEAIRSSRLGWNPKTLWRSRSALGLPEKLKDNGKPTKLWLPKGFVIPIERHSKAMKLKIRRPEPGAEPKYYMLPGSSAVSMVWGEDRRAFVIVESELDGVLLNQEAGDLTGVIALGSASNRPDYYATGLLRGAELILVALDGDDAGAKEAWRWWPEHFNRVKRWPPVGGKDPGDMRKANVDLRAWVQAGLQPVVAQPEQAREGEEMDMEGQRSETFRQLQQLYDEQAEHHGREGWLRLASIPGWTEELERREEAFNAEWRAGGNPVDQLAALADHWRVSFEKE